MSGYIKNKKLNSGKLRYYPTMKINGQERSFGGHNTKRDAGAKLREIEKAVADGTLDRDNPTFGAFVERYSAAKKTALKASTIHDMEIAFRLHILPTFKKKHLGAITPSDIQDWVSGLELSPASAQKCYRYLRACLNQAVKLDLLQVNPCKSIILPRVDRPELDFLKPEEVALVLENMSEPEATLIETLAYSGLRLGEGLGLAWRHIDFKNHALIVTRSWNVHNGMSEPKSSSSRRAVPLLPVLESSLREHFQRQGSPEPDALLFSRGKQPLDPSNVRREFEKALKAAKLKHVSIHSLRHGCASLLLSNGVSIKAVQRCLGHGSAALTLSVYSHLLGDDLGNGALKVNAVIEGARSGRIADLQTRRR